jgi:hypothetical protein
MAEEAPPAVLECTELEQQLVTRPSALYEPIWPDGGRCKVIFGVVTELEARLEPAAQTALVPAGTAADHEGYAAPDSGAEQRLTDAIHAAGVELGPPGLTDRGRIIDRQRDGDWRVAAHVAENRA